MSGKPPWKERTVPGPPTTPVGQVDTSTLDWHIVEVARLRKAFIDMHEERKLLREQIAELTQMLGQAQAGMEMADLIKRMVS